MKKIFLSFFLLSIIIAACNNSSTSKVSPDSSGAANTPGIDNVNGNVPDTSAGIKLNHPLPKDSSGVRDSTHH